MENHANESQIEKTLRILIEEYIKNKDAYLKTYEFMQRGQHFVGHRAPARISELSLQYGNMVDIDTSERTYKYRFKGEDVKMFFDYLPDNFKKIIKSYKQIYA